MRNPASQRRVISQTVAAPVGGLNGVNALAAMPETDAVVLDNWFPRTTDVSTRKGTQSYATGMSGAVETLMAYRVGVQKMFAINAGKIYNVTTAGAVGAAAVSGLSNSRWQYVNFGTPGGRFLYAVNGTDYPLLYDGTTWLQVRSGTGVAIASITRVGTLATLTTSSAHGLVNGATVTVTVTGATPSQYNVTAATINVTSTTTFTYTMASDPGASASPVGSFTYTPGIAGVDPHLLINCDTINSRMWFVESGSLRAWYLPLNSISGTAQSIDLSSLAKLGGNLAGVFGWSIASSSGMQNLTVFVTTEGEVFVFTGYDPTNAATWALAVRGRVGAPVGNRFWLRVGMDVVMITKDGFVDLSKVIQIDRFTETQAVSYKILNIASNDIASYNLNFGWQVVQFPIAGMLIVNVPYTENNTAVQYVMNTNTNSWCRYTGINANCFEYLGDKLFFGANNGTVKQAEIGYNDDGAGIAATALQAYNYFGDPGTPKRFTASRPVISASTNTPIGFGLVMDFGSNAPDSYPSLVAPGPPLYWPFAWGSAWVAAATSSSRLQFVSGMGYVAACEMTATTSAAPVIWSATNVLFQRGNKF